MKLKHILAPTKTAHHGMTVREVFEECGRVHIPALPFCTRSGRIAGRITLKNILKMSCLPEYMIDSARILGEEMSCMEDAESGATPMLDNPVDTYVQEPALSLSSEAPAIKALAMMEQNDTSYLFVVDDGQYQGVVTMQMLAKMMTQFDQQV